MLRVNGASWDRISITAASLRSVLEEVGYADALPATLDPLAAMAETDKLALKDLAGLAAFGVFSRHRLIGDSGAVSREAGTPVADVTSLIRTAQLTTL